MKDSQKIGWLALHEREREAREDHLFLMRAESARQEREAALKIAEKEEK